MQRQRGGLVPIGEAFGGLDAGPLQAIRDATPQALHHFTRFDQVNQLVSRQRSGPRSRLHGAAAGAVQPAPHQPRQPAKSTSASTGRTQLYMIAGWWQL